MRISVVIKFIKRYFYDIILIFYYHSHYLILIIKQIENILLIKKGVEHQQRYDLCER